jgi:hypothetical protein
LIECGESRAVLRRALEVVCPAGEAVRVLEALTRWIGAIWRPGT